MTLADTTASVRDRLLADRRNLLDLGTRNRLINLPLRSRNIRTIEIVDEKATEVYRLLTDGRGFTFLPGRQLSEEERTELADDDRETGGIPQPHDDEETDTRGIARRHADTRLQTRLTSEGLQKRLFDIWYDARTLEEEQGVNILYLALGLLRWFEADNSDVARHAPLVLLPVRLERTSAADRFTLKWRGEPPAWNLSLQAKMNGEFGLKIPDFGDEDELDLSSYLAEVAETVAGKARWEVLPDTMVLGFFSFAKFLMYRDLDPANWPADTVLDSHPVIRSLLLDGFDTPEPIVSETGRIDEAIPPASLSHVVDADSSQTVAIEEIIRGRHLVVKGPPGTGKSQTITNVLAAAAASGRKVLFVAEKMAALDVVHRRLQHIGLGALALELHSSKANKRVVLEELRRTKDIATRQPPGDDAGQRLGETAALLSAHADLMHARMEPSGLTPYRLLGELVRVREGSGTTGFTLRDPQDWKPSDVEVRHEVLDEIVHRLDIVGPAAAHPWRGATREPLDPSELETLAADVEKVGKLLRILATAAQGTADFLALEPAERAADLETLRRLLAAAASLPECNRTALVHPVWERAGDTPAEALRAGEAYAEAREMMKQQFRDTAWSIGLEECRTVLATKGRSLFRIFSGRYRAQVALLRSLIKGPLPKDNRTRLELLDGAISAQAARSDYEDVKAAGAEGFGMRWAGERSDWAALRSVAEWRAQHARSLPAGMLSQLARARDLTALRRIHAIVDETLPQFRATLDALLQFLKLDLPVAFGVSEAGECRLSELADRLGEWSDDPESVTRWIAFHDRCAYAAELGLGEIVAGIRDGRLAAENVLPTFERSYYEALRSDFFARVPTLRRFDRELHDRVVQQFAGLDAGRLQSTRHRIAAGHASALPRTGAGIGPLGVLNGEIAKRRGHLPIRQLLRRAGPAIQQIKPIFMMSPLSVAQYLEPGALNFDLLVMDEASQIEPVDALGAIARCGQVVVVGDERQLPPTRFFAKLTSDDIDERDDDTFQARDAESVLDLCLAKGMPHRMLNWHYRSKHHSLIAVSNKEFYENRLFIVPSPYDATAGMGLKFNYMPDAHYDRGNTRTNPKQARAVAEAVIAHARNDPEHSLGVATFSVAQRQAILKELELLRRAHPETEEYFNKSGSEPFFVKNLENIQGDERDVIFISVGYGRTAEGYMAMSFGPLNSEGGERRLNVLISRAKRRCEVFSSIAGDDIDLDRVRSRGVTALKMFLTFAQTGRLGFADESGRGPDSLFEEQVAERLRARGYDVRTQIGSAGFFVDIAIADPERPGRYVIGIECDGAQYHSARSARDRDRLRQSVLEAHGWIIHRIWSTDWYLRPNEGIEKAVAAIEAARAVWLERDEEEARPRPAVPLHFTAHRDGDTDVVVGHIGTETAEVEDTPIAIPYEEATLAARFDLEPHQVPLGEMARFVVQVVSTEGPVHESEIVTRVRSAWGLARSGSRIRDAVQAGILAALRSEAIVGGPFYQTPGQPVAIRDRSMTDSSSLRRPETLPPVEIDAALYAVIDANFGAEQEKLIIAVARLFGFAATSAQLRAAISARINAALSEGKLRADGSLLTRPTTDRPMPSSSNEAHTGTEPLS